MAIDSSIYLKQRGTQADLGAAFERGMRMGEMYKAGKEKRDTKAAFAEGVVTNEDGTQTIDRKRTMSSLMKVNPELGMKFGEETKAMAAADMKAKREKFLFDNDLVSRGSAEVLANPTQENYQQVIKRLAENGVNVKDAPRELDIGWVKANYVRGMSAKDKMQLDNDALNRQESRNERRYLHGVARQDKLDVRNEKREEKELAIAVPGYQRTGEVLAKPEEAAKFRKATATADALKVKLNRMKELVKKNGPYQYWGDAGSEMTALATDIQLLGKSPELYELGVLAGPDLQLLEKITSSPDSWSSLFTKSSTRQTQLDSQLSAINQKLSSTAKSLGYRSADKRAAGGPPAQATAVPVIPGNKIEWAD